MSISSDKLLAACICIVLAASTIAVFWQVREYDFVNYDDNYYVYENHDVTGGLSWKSFIAAFTTPHVGNWLPMVWLSFIVDVELFGLNPGYMHLTNVFFHVINTLLLFLILRRLTGRLWASAFVAAAFALHPMHVESVAWITERKDVLSCFFMLLTMAAYIRYVNKRGRGWYVAALVLYIIGLLAKPMLVTVPILLLLLDYWPLCRLAGTSFQSANKTVARIPLRKLVSEKIPFLMLSGIWSVITFIVQRSSGVVASLADLPLYARVANPFLSYTKYVLRMFWPRNMAVFYPYDASTVSLLPAFLAALTVIVISVLAIRLRTKRPFFFSGWFWFIIALTPVIGVIQSGAQSMADRYTYIPYIGLFIAVAMAVSDFRLQFRPARFLVSSIAVFAIIAIGIVTHRQTSYWRDSVTLFSHAIKVTKNNDTAYNNRGAAYNDLGRWEDAIADFTEAVAIRPENAEAYNNLGLASVKLSRWQQAENAFRNAIKVKPNYAEAYNNLGVSYGQQNRWQEAEKAFREAIRIDPAHAEALNNLGVACGKQGRWQDAADAHKMATNARKDYVTALNNLGGAYEKLNLWQEAIEIYQRTITIKPKHAETHKNLGSVMNKLGRWEEAIKYYERAIELESNYVQAFNGLGFTYGKLGRWQQALSAFQKAVALDPNDSATHHNMGIAYVELRMHLDAIASFSRAIALDPNNADAHHNLANELVATGRLDDSIEHYRAALRIRPDWADCMNNFAFLIAAYPAVRSRNLNEAVRLAERACELTNHSNPAFLDTLAIAYASVGRYSEAINTAEKALQLASDVSYASLRSDIERRISLFRQSKPYVESAESLPVDSNDR